MTGRGKEEEGEEASPCLPSPLPSYSFFEVALLVLERGGGNHGGRRSREEEWRRRRRSGRWSGVGPLSFSREKFVWYILQPSR